MEQVNDLSDYLNEKRFQFTSSAVKQKLEELQKEGKIGEQQYKEIEKQDILLRIKYKSYKKCQSQLIWATTFLVIGFWPLSSYPIAYIFIVVGFILALSALFGLKSNRISEEQKRYIKS